MLGPFAPRSLRALTLSCLLAVGFGASGCVGFVAVARGTAPFAIAEPQLSTRTGQRPPTAENLRRALGEPDRVVAAPGGERWHYREGLRWHGVALLVLVVPVPLLLPTGFEEAIVTLESDRAVALEGRDNVTLGRAGCLFGSPLPFGSRRGCFVEGASSPRPELRRDGASLWLAPVPSPR
jgi:hypothetical protein